jgi:S1-C subfamily serine protease
VSGLVLRVVRGAGQGRDIAPGDELVIGREADGDGRLDGEPALSRRHARITRNARGELTIEDLGSLNGTRVNGEAISAATTLRAGDRIQLGETVLVVTDPADPAAQTPVAPSQETVIAQRPRAAAPRPAAARPTPPPVPAPAVARKGGNAWLNELAERRELQVGAVAALLVIGLVLWTLLRGGGEDPQSILRDGQRSTVQLIIRPSGVVQRLARVAPGTAPPRSGSGIVVDVKRGLILTADRLVAGAARISGRFGGGRAREVTLVARAPCEGIALVRLPGLPGGARAADLGAAGALARGDHVFALGYPGSRVGAAVRSGALRASEGVVVGARRSATLDPADPRLRGLIFHSAPVGAGGGGGPLVDADGDTVGLNLVPPDRARVNDAVPIERAAGLYGDLATARTERDLGVRLEPWSEIRTGRPGLLVTGVDAGGPRLLGATIFSIDGRRVDDAADVCRALAGTRRGERVTVRADLRSTVRRASRGRAVAVRVRL